MAHILNSLLYSDFNSNNTRALTFQKVCLKKRWDRVCIYVSHEEEDTRMPYEEEDTYICSDV